MLYEDCPHCGALIPYDDQNDEYIVECPTCGKRVVLCNKCVTKIGLENCKWSPVTGCMRLRHEN